MEENLRKIDENSRRMEENWRRMEEDNRQRTDKMNRWLQDQIQRQQEIESRERMRSLRNLFDK